MNIEKIQENVISYVDYLMDELPKWVEKSFPQITDDWWDDLVLDKIDIKERNEIKRISDLDFINLIDVIDRNWFVIVDSFGVDNSCRVSINALKKTFNQIYCNPDIVSSDDTLMRELISLRTVFRGFLNYEGDIILDINIMIENLDMNMKDISCNKGIKSEHENNNSKIISEGSMVFLKNNVDKIGAVVGVSGSKYSVFIDNKIKTFYIEQIELYQEKKDETIDKIESVKSSLTAYQIDNPGNRNLYSLNTSRIDFVPYQFRPALKLIKADVPNILIADDVGVGKTIEAGLIIKEIEAREKDISVLVICPRPLITEKKWKLEMERFDQSFTQLDGIGFRECMNSVERYGEWPTAHKKTIMPYSLFSEISVFGEKRDGYTVKTGMKDLNPFPKFDLVIVDEAHNIRNSTTWMHKGVKLFCENANSVVFLTATPLQNSNNDLFNLLNILRPDLIADKDTFDMMSEPNVYINNMLNIIRKNEDSWNVDAKNQLNKALKTRWGNSVLQYSPKLKHIYKLMESPCINREEKVNLISDVESLHSFNSIINRTRRKDIEDFCIRRTQTVNVPMSEAQKKIYNAVLDFEKTRLGYKHSNKNVKFMMCTIMRQTSSCIYGLLPFLDDVLNRRIDSIADDGELSIYDINIVLGIESIMRKQAQEIKDMCKNLSDYDPKFDKMMEIINQKRGTTNRRVIIFSSFRHTLAYINKKLCKAGIRTGQIDGTVGDDERQSLRSRFLMEESDPEAIDVLLFSEVGCEGLDYQFCDTMINYDLPWNPMRIEQRIGRIDRRGQKSDTVKIYNMITDDTIDANIYYKCLNKIGIFESSIGECSEILGNMSSKIFDIMFNPKLTSEEQKYKLEQISDFEVRKIQELNRLEEEEKELYGFDLSKHIDDCKIQNAENVWINSDYLQDMVESFVKDYFNSNDRFFGTSQRKTLRLNKDKREKLLADLGELACAENISKLKWKKYLKSKKTRLSCTFNSEYAKEHDDITFLNQMHPLVLQAARYEVKKLPMKVSLAVKDSNADTGMYYFVIYAWKFVGENNHIEFVPVCTDRNVEDRLMDYIHYAADDKFIFSGSEDIWDNIDSIQYSRWQDEKKLYDKFVREKNLYELERINLIYNKKEQHIVEQIDKITDEKIKRMKISEMNKNADRKKREQDRIESNIRKSDIYVELLVKGVISIMGR